jgi:hypothetical protein
MKERIGIQVYKTYITVVEDPPGEVRDTLPSAKVGFADKLQ